MCARAFGWTNGGHIHGAGTEKRMRQQKVEASGFVSPVSSTGSGTGMSLVRMAGTQLSDASGLYITQTSQGAASASCWPLRNPPLACVSCHATEFFPNDRATPRGPAANFTPGTLYGETRPGPGFLQGLLSITPMGAVMGKKAKLLGFRNSRWHTEDLPILLLNCSSFKLSLSIDSKGGHHT